MIYTKYTYFQATLNQMLSAIFSRMENKTLEIEEMEKMVAEAEAQVAYLFQNIICAVHSSKCKFNIGSNNKTIKCHITG